MLAAPLIAGNDVRTMSARIAAILLNREVIAVDQDPAATQGTFLPGDDRIMVKRLADGSVAVALLNRSRRSADIATTARAVGLPAARCYTVRDLWSHRSRTTTDAVAGNDIPAHGVAMFRVAARC
jgi:alpha-galactosidase